MNVFFFYHIVLKLTFASSCLIFPEYDAMMFGPIRMEIYQSRCVATASCENWGPAVGIHMLSLSVCFITGHFGRQQPRETRLKT